MDSKLNNEIVIELIVSELLLGKMMLGLHRLHIDASSYSLNLSQVIFRLIGFGEDEQTEELYDQYTLLCLKALDTNFDLNDSKAIKLLAIDIHASLICHSVDASQDDVKFM